AEHRRPWKGDDILNAFTRGQLMTKAPNRWVIACAGVAMQIALGAVNAWRGFRIPLTRAFGWTIAEVTLAFTIAIFVLGFAAFGGGLWMRPTGSRHVPLGAGGWLRVG